MSPYLMVTLLLTLSINVKVFQVKSPQQGIQSSQLHIVFVD